MVRLFRDPPIACEDSVDAHSSLSPTKQHNEQSQSLPFFESYPFVAWDQVDFGPWRNGQKVWVCKSKGRKKSQHGGTEGFADARQRRPELFLRACIVSVDNDVDDRILVQYPAGSTYRVRRDLLVPILDFDTVSSHNLHHNMTNLIVVYAEPNEYRRASVTHTGPNEDFLEIGCAQGVTCHRVHTTTSTTSTNNNKNAQRRAVVGLDKSESSIATARQRYPACHFLTADILEESNDPDDPVNRVAPPSVVALDVNGNRELEAVVQCLKAVLARWKPRLVLVKSRALYHCVAVRHGNTTT